MTAAQRQVLRRKRIAKRLDDLMEFEAAVRKLADRSRMSDANIRKALEALIDEFTPISDDVS